MRVGGSASILLTPPLTIFPPSDKATLVYSVGFLNENDTDQSLDTRQRTVAPFMDKTNAINGALFVPKWTKYVRLGEPLRMARKEEGPTTSIVLTRRAFRRAARWTNLPAQHLLVHSLSSEKTYYFHRYSPLFHPSELAVCKNTKQKSEVLRIMAPVCWFMR